MQIDLKKMLQGLFSALWKYICSHVWPCIGGFFSLVVAVLNTSFIPWLKEYFVESPSLGFALLAIVTACWTTGSWLHWRIIAKQAMTRSALVPVLKAATNREKKKNKVLEAKLRSENGITTEQMMVISFLCTWGEGTVSEIKASTGITEQVATSSLQHLTYLRHYTAEAGKRSNGHTVYVLSDSGKNFAQQHKLPLNDRRYQVRVSDAERELNSLRQSFNDAKKAIDEHFTALMGAQAMVSKLESENKELKARLGILESDQERKPVMGLRQ